MEHDKSTRLPLTFFSAEEELFRDNIASFARERIGPYVSEMDEASGLRPGLLDELFQLGLMGIETPEHFGGSGCSFFMAILAIEELSRVDPAISVVVDVHNTLVNRAIALWGTQDQKERYLRHLATDWVGAYALSEATSGSDAFALKTRATLQENRYLLNGRKLWITNAAEASLFVIFATVDPSAGYRGITAFLVERDFPGLEIGKKESKLGVRASSTCELILENCPVPAENVLGEVGKGYKIAIETLNEGRIGIGAQMVGLARGALEEAIRYSRERVAFGKSIAEFQGVHFPMAHLATEIESARLLVYNAAHLKESGRPFVTEAAMAKYHAAMVAERVTSHAIEVLGGFGYTRDYPVEKYYRDAKVGKIYEGTSNMQLATIAKRIIL